MLVGILFVGICVRDMEEERIKVTPILAFPLRRGREKEKKRDFSLWSK